MKSRMIWSLYKILRFFLLISSARNSDYCSDSFTKTCHQSCSRSVFMLLHFATFQPASTVRVVSRTFYSYAAILERGSTELLKSNISYWLLRVKFQMHNGCSLQMFNGKSRCVQALLNKCCSEECCVICFDLGRKRERLVFFWEFKAAGLWQLGVV